MAFPAERVFVFFRKKNLVLFDMVHGHFYVLLRAFLVSTAVFYVGLVKEFFDRISDALLYNLFSPMFHVVGSMENFINQYFIDPIWSHSGYNIVNTVTYAAIALIAVYAIFRILEKRIKIDEKFVCAVLWFVLLGASMRTVTDSIDSGVFKAVTPLHAWILDSHIYDYGYLTVSPGVYIVTAFILFVSIAVLHRIKRMELLSNVGMVLAAFNLLLLVPFMQYWIYAIPVLILAGIPVYFAYRYFKNWIMTGIVGGHALDGAATFFAIEIFPKFTGIYYSEQHVFSGAIGILSGNFFAFFLVKIIVAFGAAYVLSKEKIDSNEKNYIALVLMIIGFAPGIRDVLRMVVGA